MNSLQGKDNDLSCGFPPFGTDIERTLREMCLDSWIENENTFDSICTLQKLISVVKMKHFLSKGMLESFKCIQP